MSAAQKFDLVFLKHIGAVIAAAAVFGTYPVLTYATDETARGIAAGAVLSVFNVMMGYAVIRYSSGKEYTEFMQIVLGGIAVRLFVMVGLLLMAVGVLKFHAFSLISSLFVMYIVFLIVEVMYIHKHSKHS
jgi:hypothetical protein